MEIGSLVAYLGADIKELRKGVRQAEKHLRDYSKKTDTELGKVNAKWKSSGTVISSSIKKIGAAVAIYFSIDAIRDWTKEIVESGVRIQSLANAFKAIRGTAIGAGQELEFVRDTAHDLGLNLMALEDSYKLLAAASLNTSLEGQGARDVFYAVAEATSAMQLSATQSHAALYALQQMMSKGRVQTEELRRQLGEQLPGAFKMAAEAMGVTEFELNRMLERGEVVSEEFLPKFAKVLHERFGMAAKKNAELARGSFNRFSNAVEHLKRTLAESGILDFFDHLAKKATKAVVALDKMIEGDDVGKLKQLQKELALLQKGEEGGAKIAYQYKGNASSMQDYINMVRENGGLLETQITNARDLRRVDSEYIQSAIKGENALAKARIEHLKNEIFYIQDKITLERLAVMEALAKEEADKRRRQEISYEKERPSASYLIGLEKESVDRNRREVTSKEITAVEKALKDWEKALYKKSWAGQMELRDSIISDLDSMFDEIEDAEEKAIEEYYEKFNASINKYQKVYKDLNRREISDEDFDRTKKWLEQREADEEKLTEVIKRNTLDQFEYKKYVLDQEVEEWRKRYKENKKMLDLIEQYYKTTYEKINADKKEFEEKQDTRRLKEIEKALKTIKATAQEVFKNLEDQIVSFITNAKFSFEDLADSIIADLARIATQQMVTTPLTNWFSGFFGGSAKGNVFGSMGLAAFGAGGAFTNTIVSKPTMFASGGGLGVMGEKGDEGILPLKRMNNGNLGVESDSSGTGKVEMHFHNAPRVTETKKSQNDKGGMRLDVFFEENVAKVLSGRNRATRVLENNWNVTRTLGGR